MLAKLQPSEDVTGGPFHADGGLDEEFIFQMALWTEKYIIGRSWSFPTRAEMTKKGGSKISQKQAEETRDESLRYKKHGRARDTTMVPYHAGYDGYPTLSEITGAINQSGLSGVTLKESEMTRLLNILRWDGRIEEVPNRKKTFRATRSVSGEAGVSLENGLTESPCGRCPVFDLCEEDGPVNSRTCVYFQEWLQI